MVVYGQRTGKTCILLGQPLAAANDVEIAAHSHIGVVNAAGDGRTTMDADHLHKIVDGVVLQALGHTHERLTYDAVMNGPPSAA